MTNYKNTPVLRFKEFEGEWEMKQLRTITTINPKTSNLADSFIYIDLESVNSGSLLKENLIFKESAPSRAQRVLSKNDILYQTVRPYQKNNFYFNLDGDYVASTGYAQIRSKNNSDSNYIYHFLHTDSFVKKVLVRCTGTSYPAINSEHLATIIINFPTVPEQQKIANFLTATDTKIQQLRQKKELLNDYKKGVMQQIFKQEIRFKNDVGGDFEDWEVKKLGEVGRIITGKTPSTTDENLWNGEIQFITPTDINENQKYQLNTKRYVVKTLKMNTLPKNTIIYTCIASIGKMCLSVKPCVTNQQINSLIPKKEYDNEYVYYYLLFMTPKIKSVQANTTLPIINKTEFSKFKIRLPSLPEQQKIANFLTSIDERIGKVSDEIGEMERYKKGLLQGMFV
jgi:type I restriction enzyme S subunit